MRAERLSRAILDRIIPRTDACTDTSASRRYNKIRRRPDRYARLVIGRPVVRKYSSASAAEPHQHTSVSGSPAGVQPSSIPESSSFALAADLPVRSKSARVHAFSRAQAAVPACRIDRPPMIASVAECSLAFSSPVPIDAFDSRTTVSSTYAPRCGERLWVVRFYVLRWCSHRLIRRAGNRCESSKIVEIHN